MFGEPTLAEAVGLRHVIEDGLAVLEGRKIDETRREFVVQDIRKLLAQALRGSEIASEPRLYLAESDRQAFGSFAMFGRYLNLAGAATWRSALPAALNAFDSLKNAKAASRESREAAINILSAVLNQVSADPIVDSETPRPEFDVFK
jgi:hypothetical protein